MPIHHAKPVGTLMRESAALKPVHDRLTALSRLQQSLADNLPPGMKESCRVATMEGSTLVIATANGSAAARLKQMLPRLLSAIQAEQTGRQAKENKFKEQQVTAISVLVQPNFSGPIPPIQAPSMRPQIPMDKLTELVEKLEESPLKDVLGKLVSRH